jgi:DNA invertase Pin-like site-specific DNA recombinase
MPSVAVYTRLSKDAFGDQTSTSRQERAARAFCESRGWTVGEVYEDVDVSAYKPNVVRPSFERLLGDIELRRVDGVVVWKLDRLTRRPADFERFWGACEHRKVFLTSVTEPIDSSNELGVAIVRILVTFAGLESSNKSVRLTAKLRENAERGIGPGGPRPFGWTQDRRRVIPAEADKIREAAQRLLAGESLHAVATDWNEAGHRTPVGAPWHVASLRRTLVADRLVGDRTYYGTVVKRDAWPAILDRATAASLKLLMADPRRPTLTRRITYPLTGLLWCGACGAMLHGRTGRRPGREKVYRDYVCPRPPMGCSGVGISAGALERYLYREADRREPRVAQAKPSEVEDAAATLKQLSHDFYVTKRITRDEFFAARAQVTDVGTHLVGPVPDEEIKDLRLWMSARLARCMVAPVGSPGPFRPERLDIAWYTEATRPMAVDVTIRRGPSHRGWLTNEEAQHVLCDMGRDAFWRVLRSGELVPLATRGRRFRRSDVERVLQSMRVEVP